VKRYVFAECKQCGARFWKKMLWAWRDPKKGGSGQFAKLALIRIPTHTPNVLSNHTFTNRGKDHVIDHL
jgi:hypothetical protein